MKRLFLYKFSQFQDKLSGDQVYIVTGYTHKTILGT